MTYAYVGETCIYVINNFAMRKLIVEKECNNLHISYLLQACGYTWFGENHK